MLTNPIYDPYQILTKVYSDGAYLKQAIESTYIEEINRARTTKIVYGVLENDGYLSYCIKHYAEKSPKLVVRTILKISLYMMIFMEKKRYMVTDLAVELCKKLGKSGVSGFVNAFLRKFDVNEVNSSIPNNVEGKSVKFSYPLFALTWLEKEYGKERAEKIASAKSEGLCVRFTSKEFADKYIGKNRIETPFENAYIYPVFNRDENFDNGEYTFQSVGSIAICNVVEPVENMLDACAAPGGKSVLLATKCKSVVSCELHEHRVALINAYKKRMKAENITAMQKDSSEFSAEFADKFDAALCDVPCSGFGTVTENPDIKVSRTKEDVLALHSTQIKILSNVSKYVKNGGALYYSTCSVFGFENDGVVEEFLKNNTNYEVEKIESPLPNTAKKYGLQFLPDTAFGAGFYVAKLRRKS